MVLRLSRIPLLEEFSWRAEMTVSQSVIEEEELTPVFEQNKWLLELYWQWKADPMSKLTPGSTEILHVLKKLIMLLKIFTPMPNDTVATIYPQKLSSPARYIFEPNRHQSSVPWWCTALAPPGCIMKPHIDHWGSSVGVVYLFGHKLWFLWPATPHNLKEFDDFFFIKDKVLTVADTVDRLEGLQLLLADKETVEKLIHWTPAVIHAVFTFKLAAHSGFGSWNINHWDASKRVMETYLTAAE
ncbi:hypothetical protein M422DRAFT_269526 [Sphaerobolus stellatus SS14]|uniref:Unplaced genomic scaffold SPHSTscaffold_215, whole genome shotgun sequence n=1 Tax=Sphaerobolus stellatus (strain SS14) TaxID=990650 RepID=A0A0C9UV92_SPHS4|nr:hypothetical protein M422DRAFT_269526 [Sphaerobolus stellatus SS14]